MSKFKIMSKSLFFILVFYAVWIFFNLHFFCFIFRLTPSTWQNLEIISGGSLTDTIKLLAEIQGQKLATEEHFKAVERRLLKVYATVQYCIGKHGRAKVLKNWDNWIFFLLYSLHFLHFVVNKMKSYIICLYLFITKMTC